MTRRLSSVQVLRIGAQGLVKLVAEFNEQLHALKADLLPTINLGGPLNPNRLPPGLNLQQAVYLHCFYYTTELEIHSTLTYPWSRNLLGLGLNPALTTRVSASMDRVVSTCHSAMLTLHYVHIDAATPVPYVPFGRDSEGLLTAVHLTLTKSTLQAQLLCTSLRLDESLRLCSPGTLPRTRDPGFIPHGPRHSILYAPAYGHRISGSDGLCQRAHGSGTKNVPEISST